MKKPNFFIVGAAKAGTTALRNYLEQHPEIYFSPIKETHFFSKDIDSFNFRDEFKAKVNTSKGAHQKFITNQEEYLTLFTGVKEESVIGEATASYLYSQKAAGNIYQFNPNSKVVIILRDPIKRAFSHYLMDKRMSFTDQSFLEAVKEDISKTKKGWGISNLYIELGLYYQQVKRFLEIFPSNQLLILYHEDLQKSPPATLAQITAFLGIKSDYFFDTNQKHNVAALPRNAKTITLIRKLNITALIPKVITNRFKWVFYNKKNLPQLTNDDIKTLGNYFADDIEKLESLLKKDLTHWKNG